MAASITGAEYLPSRTQPRTRPALGAGLGNASPRTPRTPILGRSIASQFGSPGGFRVEQEDVVIYELNSRSLSAGYAGESRPRCIIPFTPEGSRRPGDYRQYDPQHAQRTRKFRLQPKWVEGYELYQLDLEKFDLELSEDKLERALREVQRDHLQMDSKSRKAVLVVPPLLPTPVLAMALKVFFGHFTQPPSISILTSPVLCCASAGLRNALVVDIGWDETIITAVGEYREILQRRTVRGGKLLTTEMARVVEDALGVDDYKMTFDEAEDLVQRMAWCRTGPKGNHTRNEDDVVQLPLSGIEDHSRAPVPFDSLAEPAEQAFFAPGSSREFDDHDLPLHLLAHKLLLSLPMDVRSICISRVVVTGHCSNIPGLKRRFLQEISRVIDERGWDAVQDYGSAAAKRASENKRPSPASAQEVAGKSPNIVEEDSQTDPVAKVLSDDAAGAPFVPAADRAHDDVNDPITQKAERGSGPNQKTTRASDHAIRGVESLGAWAGASLVASLRVRGVHEIERDDFLKHGFRGL